MIQTPISPLSIKMPLARCRQQMARISSSPVTTVDAQGTANLCFPEDLSWFQGNISTDDVSNYSMYGERVTVCPQEDKPAASAATMADQIMKLSLTESDEENNNGADEPEISTSPSASVGEKPENSEETYYRVILIDHFSGLKHKLPKVYARDLKNSAIGLMFTSEHGEFTFEVENIYKGQKAQMMIQKYLVSPVKLGPKCLLYSGQINILYNENVEAGTSWCM